VFTLSRTGIDRVGGTAGYRSRSGEIGDKPGLNSALLGRAPPPPPLLLALLLRLWLLRLLRLLFRVL
jgi:hypothetical protein